MRPWHLRNGLLTGRTRRLCWSKPLFFLRCSLFDFSRTLVAAATDPVCPSAHRRVRRVRKENYVNIDVRSEKKMRGTRLVDEVDKLPPSWCSGLPTHCITINDPVPQNQYRRPKRFIRAVQYLLRLFFVSFIPWKSFEGTRTNDV